MNITQSHVSFGSRHESVQQQRVSERLQWWQGERAPVPSREPDADSARGPGPSVWLHVSDRARQARPVEVPGLAVGRPSHPPASALAQETTSVNAEPGVQGEDVLEPRLRLLAQMVEALTGVKVRVLQADDLRAEAPPVAVEGPAVASGGGTAPAAPVGWGMVYERTSVQYEREVTAVAIRGEVQTQDGQRVRFELALNMQREWLQTEQVELRAGDAVRKDPLVLHFDGPLAALSHTRFEFDLDADGQTERVPFAGVGSGFLVWDRNANGRADDGRELFGARSGDGFAELADLDHDGNGWVDAGDPAFEQLRVWRRDAAGQEQYQTLAQAGVGALHVGRVSTPFSVRGEGNAPLGEVRSTGVYLKETGQAGALQQIDLLV